MTNNETNAIIFAGFKLDLHHFLCAFKNFYTHSLFSETFSIIKPQLIYK